MSESANGISSTDRIKVTLSDIARNISENEYKPKEKGLDHCVGLEHLDPGSLKIRRWLLITPEMSFTRRFYKGQILFGKRRAYQKKVGLADFDGICSSDILVIEAKKDNFVPELLPFIIQDDRFFEYAVGTSSGSLSPRTKWRFLADYEIWLPSIEEQRRIATMLWAAEDCIEKAERFVATAERTKQILMLEFFSGRKTTRTKDWKNVKFSKIVASYKNGIYKTPEFYGSGLPSIRMFNIVEGKINKINAPLLEVTDDELKEYQLLEGDILINRVNSIDLVGKAGIVAQDLGNVTYESKNIRVRVNQELIIPEFLIFYLQTKEYSRHIRRKNKSAIGQATVNQTDLADLDIPLPTLPEQRQIAAILTRCDETIAAARANVVAAKGLKMKMINEMLSPERSNGS